MVVCAQLSGAKLEVAMIFTGKVLQLLLAFGVRALRTGGRLLANATAQFVLAIKHRREAQILARLDSKMLADIGLTPADVRDAFSEPLWRDPTGVLATRVTERRGGQRVAIFDLSAARVTRAIAADTKSTAASTHRLVRYVQ